MEKFRHYAQAAVCMLAVLGVTGLFTQHSAQSTTGAPVPVQVTNTAPLATSDAALAAKQPFQATIDIAIHDATSGGSDNGNVSPGTQTFAVPAGKRLVIQTVSAYRGGTIGNLQTTQIFLNVSEGGIYAGYGLPVMASTNAPFTGSTQAMTLYADPGTRVLANAFRSGTAGAETEVVQVAGYLVDVP